uniref:Glycosyltransferase 2-like domain-containing protein n=1 Tax=Chloropicon laureae TaxID=464258 RepID=A0A7S3E2T0_9CHLO|mmetsp:Transcript_3350/g.8410  ORF Transcript_3350/g.8410 Transcript_3350/m.8410 type:complete len:553 (+) Transcript_3350:305-1963(+)
MAPNMPSNPKGLATDAAVPPAAKMQKTEGYSIMAEAVPEHYHSGNKLTVLVDMDNTLCDYEEAFVRALKATAPEVAVVAASDRLNWDICKDYPAAAEAKVRAVNGVKGFFAGMKANPGAIAALKAMAAAGHNVLIVSAPDPDFTAQCSEEKYRWVEEHLGTEWRSKVILTRDKTTVRGDFLIDDKPTCDAGALKAEWQHVVYDQTYNRAKDTGKRLSDWSKWEEVLGVKAELDCSVARNPRLTQENLYPNGINFSCVFPSFNQESIVKKTLAGLVQQKIKSDFKFEVIIVDNNSTDDIDAIYKKYRTKLDLTLVQRRKLANTFSVPSARNMGIQQAKYDYIIGMDSDVILNENFLENMYQFLSSKPNNVPYMVTAERIFVCTEGYSDDKLLEDYTETERYPRILSKANYFKPRDNRFSHGNILENIKKGWQPWAYFYGMHTAFPKKIWEKIGGYNEVYDGYWGYDDIHFAWEMTVKGGCLPTVLGGSEVFHQEPYGSEWVPLGGVVDKLGTSNPRLNKKDNPNWQRICSTIDGYADWKSDYYQKLAGDIVTL